MIQSLDLQSERFQPTGNVSAEGVKNQLGRPSMDRLTVLVRETVQNSWDARRPGAVVDYSIHGWTLSSEQREVLFDAVLKKRPQRLPIPTEAGSEPILALAVSDRGTSGLGGPTRADAAPLPGEAMDFVDFLRNVGQPPDKEHGGGTYGFGKASLYLASGFKTILVYTHCLHNGGIDKRFMAAALGPQYAAEERNGSRFTGRHWWGRAASDGVVDPVEGDAADEVASAIGLPGFSDGETGTTLVVLAPDLADRTERQAAALMGDAVLRYFWPKMLDGPDGGPSMRFSVSWAGEPAVDLNPQRYPPLAAYSRAFQQARRGAADGDEEGPRTMRCLKPKRDLGLLSVVRTPARPRRELDVGENGGSRPPFGMPCHSVALMRSPHLVVRYFEGPPLPDGRIEYAGVFIADDEVDKAFADAEPPTHDGWIPEYLEDRWERTYVRTTFKRIKEALDEITAPPAPDGAVGEEVPLGAFANQLGGLIPGEEGGGAGSVLPPGGAHGAGGESGGGGGGGGSGRGGGPSVGRTRPRIYVRGERQELVSGVPALVVEFTVEHAGAHEATVELDAKVLVLDGSYESDPPEGADGPRLLQWRGPSGEDAGGKAILHVPAAKPGPWSVVVSIPEDTAISVGLSARRA